MLWQRKVTGREEFVIEVGNNVRLQPEELQTLEVTMNDVIRHLSILRQVIENRSGQAVELRLLLELNSTLIPYASPVPKTCDRLTTKRGNGTLPFGST